MHSLDWNVIITSVSTVNARNGETNERDYIDEDGNSYKGIITNEAPIKAIASHLNGKIDAIIYIASDSVNSVIDSGSESLCMTHLEFLKKRISEYMLQNQYGSPLEIEISIEDEPNIESVSETVFCVYEKLVQWAREDKNINIYIESNGGIRYVFTMLLSLTKTLENFYDNIQISEVTGMVYDGKKPTIIKDTKVIYDTAQLSGFVSEFVNYGRTEGLYSYINNSISDMEKYPDIKRVLQKLEKTADDIQLCRTRMMLEDFYGPSNLKNTIEDFIRLHRNPGAAVYQNETDRASIMVLTHLLELILEEFGETIYQNEIDSAKETICYLPNMIKWCIQKSYIQQALTLCSERIPEYLFMTGKISLHRGMDVALNNTDTGKYEKYYYFVSHMEKDFLAQIIKLRVCNVLKKIKDDEILSLTEDEWSKLIERESTVLQEASTTSNIETCVQNIEKFLMEYLFLKANSETQVGQLIARSKWLKGVNFYQKVFISNKIRTPLKYALCGGYYDERRRCLVLHNGMSSRTEIIKKVLPDFISNYLQHNTNAEEEIEKYNQLVDVLFDGITAEDLKKKYSYTQSRKYNINEAVQAGYIQSSLPKEDLQTILYLYSMCKEQRNYSNHAHVAEEERRYALNSKQLTIIINALISKFI